ncbi:hypothetical protein [Paracoccus sediminilitoris]|uniref:hypothetical protein n=1 Tax=Paracoccus sediminilitoris TaxID=2202419 RepID=UPI00272A0A63|nr:hypothetical protein [Paracoccus sediminilitoris]
MLRSAGFFILDHPQPAGAWVQKGEYAVRMTPEKPLGAADAFETSATPNGLGGFRGEDTM